MRPDDAVARALADATVLLGQSGAPSAIDRVHTALHGYLRQLCLDVGIDCSEDAQTARLFKLLRKGHPALRPCGPRADDVTKVLNSFSAAIDALSPIRNKASLAHANPLLETPEAEAVLNATRTVFRYVDDKIKRYRDKQE